METLERKKNTVLKRLDVRMRNLEEYAIPATNDIMQESLERSVSQQVKWNEQRATHISAFFSDLNYSVVLVDAQGRRKSSFAVRAWDFDNNRNVDTNPVDHEMHVERQKMYDLPRHDHF